MQTITPVNADQRYEDVPGMSYLAIDQYQRELAWMEPLSDEQQETLLGRVARAKRFPENAHYALLARDAHDCLVGQYQPLVFKMARRWARFSEGMDALDLVNEGSIGVMEAIDRYSRYPDYHGRFPLLVTFCIRNAFVEACGHHRLISLPVSVQRRLSKIRKASSQFERDYGVSPSPAQLACLLGISEEKVLEAQYFASRQAVLSLEALAYEDEHAEESHDFVSLFQGAFVAESARQLELKALFEQVFEHALTPCERRIVQARYGIGDRACAETLRETAEELAMNLSTVDSLYSRAVNRLRGVLEPLVASSQGPETIRAQFGDYYSINEAAACLRVSPQTIRNYIAQGRFPAEQGISRSGGSARRWMLPKEAVDALRASRLKDGEEVAV